jgi:hypothetical protein
VLYALAALLLMLTVTALAQAPVPVSCPCDTGPHCPCEPELSVVQADVSWGMTWNSEAMGIHGDQGPRFDVVFVGDGFTETQLIDFQDAVEAAIVAIELADPFWRCAFNFFRIDVITDDPGGVDHPFDGVCVATPLQTGYGDPCDPADPLDDFPERCITTRDPYFVTEAVFRQALRPDGAEGIINYDIVFVLVNDTQWGACVAMDPIAQEGMLFSGIGDDFEETIIHELAHIVGPLEDEYPCRAGCDVCGDPPVVPDDTTWPHGEPALDPFANLTTETNRNLVKWRDLFSPVTIPVPTPESYLSGMTPAQIAEVVGLFEGGGWYKNGVFRPSWNCKMRCLGEPFCKVCVDAIRRAMWQHCPIDPNIINRWMEEFFNIEWFWSLQIDFPFPCLFCPIDAIADTAQVEVVLPAGAEMRIFDDVGNLIVAGAPAGNDTLNALFLPVPFESYIMRINTGPPTGSVFDIHTRVWVNGVEISLPP